MQTSLREFKATLLYVARCTTARAMDRDSHLKTNPNQTSITDTCKSCY